MDVGDHLPSRRQPHVLKSMEPSTAEGTRFPAIHRMFLHMSFYMSSLILGKTLALEIAAAEYQDDLQKDDKIRNILHGLTRFRVKRESKGIHGRSFQGAFSQFAETRQDGMLYAFSSSQICGSR